LGKCGPKLAVVNHSTYYIKYLHDITEMFLETIKVGVYLYCWDPNVKGTFLPKMWFKPQLMH